ncbi:BnaC06g26700D [Brassica napus]|uniref:BnaC06g26700D protein n=1 Tax=Brassica napus TaxID=3708 RepID=A0A078GUV0_BRANA|nr:BnaC06g26700D [Brassica napus]
MSQAEKKQSPRPSSSPITSLPEDVVVDILARVPRRDYPRVSLVLKRFRSLVSHVDRLYTLRQKEKDKGLVLIPGLPDMPTEGSFVAVGSRIYVFCGMMTSSAFFIDCTSHTVQHLPKMPVPMSALLADVIGGRIYVFGYFGTDQKSHAMVVFDTETLLWEDGMTNVMEICDGW